MQISAIVVTTKPALATQNHASLNLRPGFRRKKNCKTKQIALKPSKIISKISIFSPHFLIKVRKNVRKLLIFAQGEGFTPPDCLTP